MVIMLLVAAAISVATGFLQGEPEWADAAIILAVVVLNSVLGVVQEPSPSRRSRPCSR